MSQIKQFYETFQYAGIECDDTLVRFKEIRKNLCGHVERKVLLEVGCGNGLVSQYAVPEGFRLYIGTDFSRSSILNAKAKARANMEFLVSDALHLPFYHSVECVLCSEVLEYIPKCQTVLKEISQVLKKKGTLWVTVPSRNHPNIIFSQLVFKTGIGGQIYDNPPSRQQLLEKLEMTGFKVQKHYTFCPFISIPIPTGIKIIQMFFRKMERVLLTIFSSVSLPNLYLFVYAYTVESES